MVLWATIDSNFQGIWVFLGKEWCTSSTQAISTLESSRQMALFLRFCLELAKNVPLFSLRSNRQKLIWLLVEANPVLLGLDRDDN